jgi:hypothetical protein
MLIHLMSRSYPRMAWQSHGYNAERPDEEARRRTNKSAAAVQRRVPHGVRLFWSAQFRYHRIFLMEILTRKFQPTERLDNSRNTNEHYTSECMAPFSQRPNG